MAFDGTTIEDNSITRNDGEKIQGMLYYNGSGSGEVVNTVLKNNTVSATQVQSSGVFAYMQNLDIKGSQFIGNKSIGSDGSKLTNGAVYVENQSDTAKIHRKNRQYFRHALRRQFSRKYWRSFHGQRRCACGCKAFQGG